MRVGSQEVRHDTDTRAGGTRAADAVRDEAAPVLHPSDLRKIQRSAGNAAAVLLVQRAQAAAQGDSARSRLGVGSVGRLRKPASIGSVRRHPPVARPRSVPGDGKSVPPGGSEFAVLPDVETTGGGIREGPAMLSAKPDPADDGSPGSSPFAARDAAAVGLVQRSAPHGADGRAARSGAPHAAQRAPTETPSANTDANRAVTQVVARSDEGIPAAPR